MLETKPEYTIQEKRIFIWVLGAASIAFGWILWPFASSILWACILVVLFYPVHSRLVRDLPKFRNTAALVTLLIAIIVVILPVLLVITSVINEAANVYSRYESGELDIERQLNRIQSAFPVIQQQAESWGVDLDALREQASGLLGSAANLVAKHSLNIGQNTLVFFLKTALMLYLAFFLLRDGKTIIHWLKVAIPLDDQREAKLLAKFSEVARATVKGNLVVGLVQGGLGALIFWILGIEGVVLWGALMVVASLIPAVGPALIWLPVAIYLFAIGDITQGVTLIIFGVVVIGTADNILRPILVGRDTKLPDYIVLFSTLGGLGLVGIQGFVVGPLVAALFFTLWAMFIEEFHPSMSRHTELGSGADHDDD
ncbi:MAG: AI-2E family transporter [Cellvibrionaceae bacterium]